MCRGPLEAAVRELRLIQRLEPRFNRQGKSWRQYTYLKLTAERFPRLAVAGVHARRRLVLPRTVPLHAAPRVVRARRSRIAMPLRRCGRVGRAAALTAGRRASRPSSASRRARAGPISEADYAALAAGTRRALDR